MKLKNIVETDFVNYKEPSMFLICPYCTFKCDIENGCQYCQNWSLSKKPVFDIDINDIISTYSGSVLTSAVVLGGLEPFDCWSDIQEFVTLFRYKFDDDIVIYTGYYKEEINDKIDWLKQYKNIVVKFGRYKSNQESHYDEVLGINLANKEQHAERIS